MPQYQSKKKKGKKSNQTHTTVLLTQYTTEMSACTRSICALLLIVPLLCQGLEERGVPDAVAKLQKDTSISDSDQELMNKLEGTWTSKSHQVFTGPGFYDPIDELLIEPSLPGISFSFTNDGYWEEARYIVTPNPRNPACPQAIMIYQHGTYTFNANNGSLMLYPFASDGRQLLSDPCNDGGVSVYTRYQNINVIKWFLVEFDEYHGCDKLTLYAFDGSPMQPMYIAYKPPVMLPTQVLNPTADTAVLTKRSLKNVRDRVKRHVSNLGKSNAQSRFFEDTRFKTAYWVAGSAVLVASAMFIVI